MSNAQGYADFHRRSIEDRDVFWAEQAKLVDWHKPFDRVCNYDNPPFARWFEGGLTNLCHNAVDRHLKDRADQNALIFVSTETNVEKIYSFRELHAEVQRMAAILQDQGVKKGDRVLIYMPMIPEAAFAMLACVRIGAIHSVVFGGFASHSLASRIEDASPIAIVSADAGSRGGKVVEYKPLLDEAIKLSAHKPQKVVMVNRGLAAFNPVEGRDVDYSAERARHMDTVVPCEWVDATHPSYTLYTSGTTGKPKGCIWGQREYRQVAQLVATEQLNGPGDKALLVMPMFHFGAQAIQLGMHFRGGTVYLHSVFDPAALLAAVVSEKLTLLHLAPTMVQMLLEHPAIGQTRVDSVRTVVYSAAVMPTPVLRRGLEIFGNVFTNLYGQTEVVTSGLVKELHRPHGSEREQNWLNSIGHPFPDTFVRIVDDHGNEVARGEPGEIQVRSTVMARGYWNNDIATIETFRDGWCHTGDVGRVDEDGFLYLVDRKKDVIISGGENIYSREVEEAVLQHPAVSECAVVGVADEKWGESVCAVVVLRAGKTASGDEIIAHTKALIASYKKPKFVEIVSELPKFPTGKINKVELRRQFASAHS